MGLISERDKKMVGERLDKLQGKIKLVLFTQEMECRFCRETRELAEELSGLSDKISLEVKDFVKDAGAAGELGVDKIPALAVLGEGDKDYGIRFFGIPSGYEFMSLLESMEIVSSGESGLSPDTKEMLKNIKKPLPLQVFVTPTCPYCPKAVVLAFRLAVESPQITAAMVEASEFPHLANRYQVSGVPHTVIGESPQPMIGAHPEHAAVEMILAAAS